MVGAGGPNAPSNRAGDSRWWLIFVRAAGEGGWGILRVGMFSARSLASQMRASLSKFKMETSKRQEERKSTSSLTKWEQIKTREVRRKEL
jgi:hypothetical protein